MADQNHGIAARLRTARLQQGLGIDELARELKNPRAVLDAIERGDWARLGAPVFARHLVGRYASRLGVSVDLDDVVERIEAPVLRPQVSTSRMGRLADLSTRNAAYVGGSLLVLPLLYFALSQTASGPAEYRPLDPVPSAVVTPVPAPTPASTAPAETVAAAAVDGETPAAPMPGVPSEAATAPADALAVGAPANAPATPAGPAATVALPPNPTPVAASLAGVLPESPQLELRFRGDSWIEVFGRDGGVVERVLARDGDERRFAAGDIGRVTIGNVDATEVRLNGSRVNLDAVRAANVARFALSSDGSIEAVAR